MKREWRTAAWQQVCAVVTKGMETMAGVLGSVIQEGSREV